MRVPQQQQEALAARRQQELEQQRQRERQELEQQQRLEQLHALRSKDRSRESKQGWGLHRAGGCRRLLGAWGEYVLSPHPSHVPPGAIASTEVKLKLQEFLLSKTKEPGTGPPNHSLPQHPKCW